MTQIVHFLSKDHDTDSCLLTILRFVKEQFGNRMKRPFFVILITQSVEGIILATNPFVHNEFVLKLYILFEQ